MSSEQRTMRAADTITGVYTMRTMTAVVYKPTNFYNGDQYRAEIWLDDMPQDEWFEDAPTIEEAHTAADNLLSDITASSDEHGNAVLNDGETVINKGVIIL